MSFFKRALISIWQRKGRTSLFLGLFLIVFLLILSGFAIQQSAEKSKVDARKQLGAEVRLKRDNEKIKEALLSGNNSIKPLSRETIDNISSLPQIKSVQLGGEASAAKGDLKSVAATASSTDNAMNPNLAGNYNENQKPTFRLYGTNALLKTTDFKNHDSKLIDGEGITDKTPENSAVVEQTFAENNQLKVGDKFKLTGFSLDGNGNNIEYQVVGIYKTDKVTSALDQMYEMAQPENQIYVDIKSFVKTSDQANIEDVTFYLNDPMQVEHFVKDAEKKMPAEGNFYKLDSYTEQYKQMIGPIEKMSAFSSIMIKVIVIAGGLILTFLSLLSIRDRKKEVGILLSLGETKMKVIVQLVTEIVIIGLISFALSVTIVQISGQTVANAMLSKQVAESEQVVPTEDEYGEEIKTVEPVDQMELQLNSTVVTQAAGLGFLLIVLTTLVPSIMIARTDPKDLFAQKE